VRAIEQIVLRKSWHSHKI